MSSARFTKVRERCPYYTLCRRDCDVCVAMRGYPRIRVPVGFTAWAQRAGRYPYSLRDLEAFKAGRAARSRKWERVDGEEFVA